MGKLERNDMQQTETAAPGPQGLSPRPGSAPHPNPRIAAQGITLLDPASLRNDQGHDPFLAFPDGKGGTRITQVGAEYAAELLTCDPRSGGTPVVRLATDAEVAAHRAPRRK